MLQRFILLNDWTHFILESPSHPTRLLLWVIVVLVVLFLLSRTHNILEEKSVNQAIRISRGLISSLLVFIVGPIVLFLILNGMALVHNLPLIHIDFILDWIWLTISSFWWLIRCLFNSADLVGAKEAFSIDAVIRIIWILLPSFIIWFKTFSSAWSRFLFLPLVMGIFMATIHMKSPPTFLTSNGIIPTSWSSFGFDQPDTVRNSGYLNIPKHLIKVNHSIIFLVVSFFVWLRTKNKKWTLFYFSIGICGLFFSSTKRSIPSPFNRSADQLALDSLTNLLTNQRYNQLDKIKIYDISNEIKSILDANPI